VARRVSPGGDANDLNYRGPGPLRSTPTEAVSVVERETAGNETRPRDRLKVAAVR
jgi:hypothetical protein